MTDINVDLILDLIKQYKIEPDFSKKDYNKLIDHFKKNELNQFYMFIVQKVLIKKQFTVSNEEMITEMTATLADRVGKMTNTKIKIENDELIKVLSETAYKVLYLSDIKEFYNKKF